ncbi:MAG: serine/threonine-protein kinase [Planctomycetota bacterium]
MLTPIPDTQVRFAQLTVKQRYLQPDKVLAAVELYRRYQAAGGEVPSLARILVGKGWLERQKAEVLLRHILGREPLPPTSSSAQSGRQTAPAAGARPEIKAPQQAVPVVLPEPAEAPSSAPPVSPLFDDRETLRKGLGALIVPKNLVKGYTITNVKGEGSMGIVYRAHQLSMDRTVALKVLPAERTKDQRFVEEFLSEARNAGRLNHPNLIHVHEVNKSGEVYYYSMEYIEGEPLEGWMDECEGGRVDPKRAVQVFIQIAGALDYGFRAGVIHREIRPNSIMVCDDGQAKLGDLGLAKGEESRFFDGENAAYVAPEQVNNEPVDTRTDIYCLGCCLFHCLTGEAPFQGSSAGSSPKEVLYRRLTAPTPNPLEYNPNLPPSLAKVVMKMMARSPAARYQTPAEVAEALKAVSFVVPAHKKTVPLRGGFRRPVAGARPGAGARPASGAHPMPGRRPPPGHPQGLRDKRRPGR